MLLLPATGALGAELFENVHVLKWPKGTHGYRGSMGDFVQLKDGQILLSYIYATYPTTPYYGHNYYRRSADEGKTVCWRIVRRPGNRRDSHRALVRV